ncbi:hypothetical protein B0T14DRAFT_307588 [Immersiella caudata]|uniref:Uncharacterized protein n=1 Tax=Immersiella caudata TaxID=314043 RepID=A0AA39WFA2_9PEZI|nr:hypothetical protein B0T14DRAFT_307588 [Immersiella caudata]
MNAPKLLGRTAAVTGASRGIGKAIAMRFAMEGARVLMLGRSQEALIGARDEIKKLSGVQDPSSMRLEAHEHDVRVPENWKYLAKMTPELDILVNCAGITQNSLLARTDPKPMEDILATNLQGAIYGCKWIGRQMMRNCRSTDGYTSCIINVSSLLAFKGVAGTSVYAASKAGLLGLTTSLAAEYAPAGVRVNAIVPGYIATDMTKDLGNLVAKMKIPLNRLGTPDEVADAALFLAANDYASNCILNLDGGLSAV